MALRITSVAVVFTNFFNRTSSSGEILRFAQDGTAVGHIASYGNGRISVNSGDVGLVFCG